MVAIGVAGLLAAGGAWPAPGQGPFPPGGLVPVLEPLYDDDWVVGSRWHWSFTGGRRWPRRGGSRPGTRRTPGSRADPLARDQADRLRGTARAWIADDPDPADRAELRALLETGDLGALAGRFGSPLTFGTAGIRGPIGAGPARMNRATVRRVTVGLARYLDEVRSPVPGSNRNKPGGPRQPVVIGYDARHGSREFADEAAAVLTGAGRRVLRLPGPVPTPVLAFAVRHLRAIVGVMVTASHNPRGDNGVKVYWTDGAQIVPPVDTGIAAAAAAAGPLRDIPLGDPGEALGDEVTEAYLDAILAAVPLGDRADRQQLHLAYTPLHGVGLGTVLRAFARAGFAAPAVVAAQAEPDGAFPTLPRPNPEEPGVLNLLIAEGDRSGADLLLANDPDADRLAAVIPGPAGGWRVLTGDEIGALLGDHLLRHERDPGRRLLVTTVVSSGLLGRMAAAAGAGYAETLTGFKWIMRAADGVDGQVGLSFLFGYEEALGYAVTDRVRDKDGMSAAVALAGAAAEARSEGGSLATRLDDLARRFGLFTTGQFSVTLAYGREADKDAGPASRQDPPGNGAGAGQDKGAGAALLGAARATPPVSLLGQPVTVVDDLGLGLRSREDGTKDPLALPRSDVIIWRCGDGTRVALRPSGTEPKVKIYLQVVLPAAGRTDLAPLRAQSARRLADLREEVTEVLNL